jgi:hypothetical protein
MIRLTAHARVRMTEMFVQPDKVVVGCDERLSR